MCCNKVVGAILVLLILFVPPTYSHQRNDDAEEIGFVPNLEELGTWLRRQSDKPILGPIILLECSPSPSERVNTEREPISRGELGDPRAQAHNADLSAWINRSTPATEIVHIRNLSEYRSDPDQFRRQLRAGATVYWPWSHLISQENPRDLMWIVTSCWEKGCLLLTVCGESAGPCPLPGILVVRVAEEASSLYTIVDDAAGMNEARCDLLLPRELLRIAPDKPPNDDASALAAAYILSLAAGLPADGGYAHLERAARLVLASSQPIAANGSGNVFRRLNPDASYFPQKNKLAIGDQTFGWHTRLSDLPANQVIDLRMDSKSGQRLRFVAAVPGQIPLRWVLAVSHLARIPVDFVLPYRKHVAVAFDASTTDGPILELLQVHEVPVSKTAQPFFYTVTPDMIETAHADPEPMQESSSKEP